jgi:hypothetical protein
MAKYTTYEQDQIEAILYYQYRIDKAYRELLENHSKRSIWQKLQNIREKREKV